MKESERIGYLFSHLQEEKKEENKDAASKDDTKAKKDIKEKL